MPNYKDLISSAEKPYTTDTRGDSDASDFEFQTHPFRHQIISFNFARSLDQSALFLEQGLGKAKITIDLATWRYREGQVQRVLVLCPNSVVGQWRTELKKHGHHDFNNFLVLEGPTTKKIKELGNLSDKQFNGWIITNYEALLGLQTYLVLNNQRGKLFQMMVLDESSKIKHAQAKRSKYSWQLGKTVRYRNILTGTPITQTLEDVFSQYRFLNESIFGRYATAFRAQYLVMGGFEMRQVVGYRNIDEALKKIYTLAIRFTKDRCLDLPEKVYERRAARMDPETSKKYLQFEKDCVAVFDGKTIAAPLVLTKMMKLSQVTGGFIYEQASDGTRVGTHSFSSNPKLAALDELLDEIMPKKTIIWARFTEELRLIRELLFKKKIKHVSISGDVKASDRGHLVDAFQTVTDCSVFVGQISTAGLGITLTAASNVIYYSNTYSLEDRLQSEDRCHRIGQKNKVTYIDILAETDKGKKTIDHDILAVIKGKAAFADQVSLALMQRMTQRVVAPAKSEATQIDNFEEEF